MHVLQCKTSGLPPILVFRKCTPADEHAHGVVVAGDQYINAGEPIGVYNGVMHTSESLNEDSDSDEKQVCFSSLQRNKNLHI